MEHIRGNVVHCSRFGCVVRLDDGRLATLPASERGIDVIKRALGAGRHPQFPFVIAQEHGRRIRVALALPDDANEKQRRLVPQHRAASPRRSNRRSSISGVRRRNGIATPAASMRKSRSCGTRIGCGRLKSERHANIERRTSVRAAVKVNRRVS